MVYQSYNFGSKFKELRRSKGISIEKVAKDITSKSHLSNWKNGKATLDITVFVKLLSGINIQPAEFFKDYEVYELHAYTDDIVEMYANLGALTFLIAACYMTYCWDHRLNPN